MKKTLKLQTRLTIFVCIVVLIALCITFFTISVQTADRVKEEERTTALRTAKLVAETPSVARALQTRKGLKELRDYTLDVQHTTGTEFVVVMDMNSIRLTHPTQIKSGRNSPAETNSRRCTDISKRAHQRELSENP